MRKLKTIYSTYNCCVEQACSAGLSTEECDHFLSTSTCMYWEGSIYKSLINVALSFVAKLLANIIPKKLLENNLVNCVLLVLRLVQVPQLIEQVITSFHWMSESFDEPNCEDLGFKKISLRPGYVKKVQDELSDELEEKLDAIDNNPLIKEYTMSEIKIMADKELGYVINMDKEEMRRRGMLEGIEDWRVIPVESSGIKGTFVATDDYAKIWAAYGAEMKELMNLNLLIRISAGKGGELLSKLDTDKQEQLYNLFVSINTEAIGAAEFIKEITELTESFTDEQKELAKEAIDEFLQDPDVKKLKQKIMTQQKDIILKKARHLANKRAMYELTYELLSMSLGKYAYDLVDQKCEDDWKASEKELDFAIQYKSSDNTKDICQGSGKTTATVQAYRKPESNYYTYRYSYTIAACKEDIDYEVVLVSDDEESVIKQRASLKFGEKHDSGIKQAPPNKLFDKVCIKVSDKSISGGKVCSDIVAN